VSRPPDPPPAALLAALDAPGDLLQRLQRAVEAIARVFGASTCTLHGTCAAPGAPVSLELLAAVGLPPPVLEKTRVIPFGKGMAGICAERKAPVSVCNLQTDASGVVRPGAKDTKVAGALVVPILTDGRVLGTLGVGKPDDYEYPPGEVQLLERCAETLKPLLLPYQQ
jgi:signal transduction protein with GAF and PtsI domain